MSRKKKTSKRESIHAQLRMEIPEEEALWKIIEAYKDRDEMADFLRKTLIKALVKSKKGKNHDISNP